MKTLLSGAPFSPLWTEDDEEYFARVERLLEIRQREKKVFFVTITEKTLAPGMVGVEVVCFATKEQTQGVAVEKKEMVRQIRRYLESFGRMSGVLATAENTHVSSDLSVSAVQLFDGLNIAPESPEPPYTPEQFEKDVSVPAFVPASEVLESPKPPTPQELAFERAVDEALKNQGLQAALKEAAKIEFGTPTPALPLQPKKEKTIKQSGLAAFF